MTRIREEEEELVDVVKPAPARLIVVYELPMIQCLKNKL